MAAYNRREVLIRYVEYLVPLGYSAGEFGKALTAASYDWEKAHPGERAGDDWATVTADDEYVIIRLTLKEHGSK